MQLPSNARNEWSETQLSRQDVQLLDRANSRTLAISATGGEESGFAGPAEHPVLGVSGCLSDGRCHIGWAELEFGGAGLGLGASVGYTSVPSDQQVPTSWQVCAGAGCVSGGQTTSGDTWFGGSVGVNVGWGVQGGPSRTVIDPNDD